MKRTLKSVVPLAEVLLAAVFPADCLLCLRPLPWRQRGSVCLPCWGALPWSPGLRLGPAPLRAIFWAAEYEGRIRRLVHGFKFEGMDYLGDALGSATAARLDPLLRAAGVPRPDLIVPVPLHWWKRYRRGYNQALLLARPLARRLGVPIVPGLLGRRRFGRAQLGLSRPERLRALEGCFRSRRRAGRGKGPRLAGRTVLVVDDVVTTGATLEACARALLRAGARAVLAAALARTPPRRGRAAADDGLRR